MSTATTPQTFSDLYTDLQNRVRDATGVTATQNIAKRYINLALHDMHIGFSERFPWAERRSTLLTHAPYETGTVTITQGSAALTGSSTLWDTDDGHGRDNMRTTGRIQIDGGDELYTISAVGGDTSATLGENFVPDDASAVEYKYFEDEYALAADFARPIDQQSFESAGYDIVLIGRREFRREVPRNFTFGKPKLATIVEHPFSGNTTPVRRIRFYPIPDAEYLIPYSYITSYLAVTSAGAEQTQLVNDADEPIVPLRYRYALIFHALYHWYRDRKDDARSQEAKAEYVSTVSRIAADFEIGQSHPSIAPNRRSYVRSATRPYSRGTGRRYDVNGRFDRME